MRMEFCFISIVFQFGEQKFSWLKNISINSTIEAKNIFSKKWKLKKKDYINVEIGFFVRIYQPKTWMS